MSVKTIAEKYTETVNNLQRLMLTVILLITTMIIIYYHIYSLLFTIIITDHMNSKRQNKISRLLNQNPQSYSW